jgi:hypothetical protein
MGEPRRPIDTPAKAYRVARQWLADARGRYADAVNGTRPLERAILLERLCGSLIKAHEARALARTLRQRKGSAS